jgi:hypothetical protein
MFERLGMPAGAVVLLVGWRDFTAIEKLDWGRDVFSV